MNKPLALIIDDEPDLCELLALTLQKMQVDSHSAHTLAQARQLLSAHPFNLCLTDMRLPDGNGIDLVRFVQTRFSDLPIAVITAHGNMEAAIEALKAGAFDFVSKPVDLQMLRTLVQTALRLGEKYPEADRRTRDVLIGDSPVMQQLRGNVAKLARSQAPVYISGESGTGKELVARMLHDKGPRAGKPFVPVNCGAIPAELMESEFFGHRKGSFTGAHSDKPGLFQSAQGGTLFLDEVADLPLAMQVKLLRAIQERAVRPVGEAREVPVDVRILSATHKSLPDLVNAGVFRQDLYYRLNVIELAVPPLRERGGDIDVLTPHILRKLAPAGNVAVRITEAAQAELRRYPFPGNVRELENILERASTLCEHGLIQVQDLLLAPPADGVAPATEPAASAAPTTVPTAAVTENLEAYLERVERQAILEALAATDNNKTAAAKKLGITFRALRYRLKKLGLE